MAQTQIMRVGESLPLRWSFIDELLSLPGQTLSAGTVAWVSQTPTRATFVIGSGAIVTTPRGIDAQIANDGAIGRFQAIAAGVCTVYVSVDAINPTATYVGEIQLNIQAIGSP